MRLVDFFDAALFDLDGVVYLGPRAVDGAPAAFAALRSSGVKVGFVTNNAGRTPATVAAHLVELGIEAGEGDVVNSTMALISMLAAEYPRGARLLPVGAPALPEQLRVAGFEVVEQASQRPDAVVQGYDPRLSWPQLEEGIHAIQSGARWFLANPDLTRPTDKGIVPGVGAQAYAVQVCVDVTPAIAGKPYPPLLDETVRRMQAQHPIFVGDRLDTDVLGANNVSMASLFVFTGAHGKWDLAAADPAHRPTTIGADVAALLKPARTAVVDGPVARCGAQTATASDGRGVLTSHPSGLEEELDALWALLQLAWGEVGVDIADALSALELLR